MAVMITIRCSSESRGKTSQSRIAKIERALWIGIEIGIVIVIDYWSLSASRLDPSQEPFTCGPCP